MADRLGQYFGNYRLISLLGMGGSAEVYLGEHVYLKSKAALKLLHTRLGEKDREHFLAEARLLANLIHPHIVRVLDFGVESTVPFLVMDFAANGSLRQRHPKGTPLPLMTIVNYIQQVADALQYAHDEKLIHRDIKPENMLLGRRNEVLLSDFGIAQLAQSTQSQKTQEMAGTAIYMAPEQIQGKPRPASDQYALGVVVYEWLSGVYPFSGSLIEVVTQHLSIPPPSLQGKAPFITPEIERVVLMALAKDPKRRFATVIAFANALQQACQIPYAPTLNISSNPPPQPFSMAPPPIQSSQEMIANTPPSYAPVAHEATPLPSGPSYPTERVTPPSQLGNPAVSPRSPKASISRRTVLMGLVGLGIVGVAGGSAIWLEYSQTSQTSSQISTPHPVSPARDTMFGFNPQHTHYNPDEHLLSPQNVSHLILDWAVSTGTIGLSSPAVANGIVYVGSLDHNLYAINATTGKMLWTVTTGDQIYSSPAVSKGIVYVGSFDSNLYAVNATTGKVLWKVKMGASIFPSPVVTKDVIYIGCYDKNLYAINATTGKTLWAAPTKAGIESSAAVANGIVYVGSKDYNLYAIEASTGRVVWNAPTDYEIFSSPAVANGIVYVGSKDFKFYAFDAATGRTRWVLKTGNFVNSSPAVANGIVYIGSKDAKLYAFDATTGKIIWTLRAGSEVASSAAIANGVLYVGSWDHNFYALNAATGAILWKTSTGDGIESSPAVVNGVVYVGSRDQRMYAFTLPDTTS